MREAARGAASRTVACDCLRDQTPGLRFRYMTTTPRTADKAAKTDGQRCGEDRRVATVLPMLRWMFAARCAAGRSTPNRDDQPNSETTPRMPIQKRGERAAEVLCLYAALIDK